MEDLTNKKPVSPTLKAANIGEVVSFPLSRLSVVKSTCVTLATETGRKFKTAINREEKVIKVKRIS